MDFRIRDFYLFLESKNFRIVGMLRVRKEWDLILERVLGV